MGFNFIIKLIREFGGVLLIIAAVLVFSFFDPFGWFTPNAKIESTAVLVREVRAIGELISAEYYGEALASWPAISTDDQLAEDTADVKRIVRDISAQLTQKSDQEKWDDIDDDDSSSDAERTKKQANRMKRKLWLFYKRSIQSHYKSSKVFPYALYAAFRKLQKPTAPLDIPQNNPVLAQSEKKELLLFLHDTDPDDVFTETDLRQISQVFRKNKDNTPKRDRKKDAVCIGRGIVRAGIDLSRLREESLVFHDNGEAFVSNVNVKILHNELNPWFIPQRKVKGFEILKLKGQIDSRDISRLKKLCKDQILLQAEARHILPEAKKNAETALLSFFNLVRSTPLKKVTIVDNAFDEIRRKYDTFKVIDAADALFIYSRLFDYYKILAAKDPDANSEKMKEMSSWFGDFWKKKIIAGVAREHAENYTTDTLQLDPWLLIAMRRYQDASRDSLTRFSEKEKAFLLNCLPLGMEEIDTVKIKEQYERINAGEVGF
jgi:hypothetical protein